MKLYKIKITVARDNSEAILQGFTPASLAVVKRAAKKMNETAERRGSPERYEPSAA